MTDQPAPPTRPKDLAEVKARLRAILPELRERYPISYLAVFGSWARGEQREDSDLDLLVDFDGPIGWEIVTLGDELGARLGVPVDLVTRGALRRRIGQRILQEAQSP